MIVLALLPALAGYRLARALAVDDVGSPIRVYVYGKASSTQRKPWIVAWKLVTCPWCCGFWISAFIAVALCLAVGNPGWVETITIACAAGGAQSILQSIDHRLNRDGHHEPEHP